MLNERVIGVLLAGGKARRMGGGDKCLRPLGGRPMLAHIIERARHQADPLILNANGDPSRFSSFGLPVVRDLIADFAGPLAGVLTGMDWAREHAPGAPWIVTIATDTPFFPLDLTERLLEAAQQDATPLACALSEGRAHPVFGLWSVDLFDDLQSALVEEGLRKIDLWTARYPMVEVEFPIEPIDPFFNTNRPEDLAAAEKHFRRLTAAKLKH